MRADYIESALTAPGIPYGCCHCGCGRQTPLAPRTELCRKRLAGEPIRYIRGHNRRSASERWIEADDGCWIWQLGQRRGYGRAHDPASRKGIPAHRKIYTELVGPIPEGLVLDHLCRNPLCVNPAHLEPVTEVENLRRASNTILNMEAARAIRASSLSQTKLAAQYGVSQSTISAVKRGLTFREDAA